MKGQYVIISLIDMDFMKNKEGKINYYDTLQEAADIWSSTEYDNFYAWYFNFTNGNANNGYFSNKANTYYVRAVRKFSI